MANYITKFWLCCGHMSNMAKIWPRFPLQCGYEPKGNAVINGRAYMLGRADTLRAKKEAKQASAGGEDDDEDYEMNQEG